MPNRSQALSAFGALMDDRGISSRLGASNHTIHTAESSDVRFTDVREGRVFFFLSFFQN